MLHPFYIRYNPRHIPENIQKTHYYLTVENIYKIEKKYCIIKCIIKNDVL